MSIALLFWILMLLWLVLGLLNNWPGGLRPIGGHVLLFVLIALIGWQVFGAAVHK